MGYYTSVVVWYKEKRYYCGYKDGFENWCEEAIRLIIDEFMIYKDYIKNMRIFLNVDRSKKANFDFWPKWKSAEPIIFGLHQIYWINITTDKISVHRNVPILYEVKITKQKNQQFIEFINRRFLLKHICNKYNLPKDLHQHLMGFF
jgi:hypothetical protein